jgi:hypothetical protein
MSARQTRVLWWSDEAEELLDAARAAAPLRRPAWRHAAPPPSSAGRSA